MALLTVATALLQMITLFVSPAGTDANPGTADRPLRSFDGARIAAQRHRGEKVVVEFASGTYRLPKPVVFTANDSGDVTYEARPGASVTISGSVAFRPHWTAYKGKILQCAVPPDFDTDQLFIDGEQQTLARYPNEDLSIRILHGYAGDAISPERVARWGDSGGGFLHAMHAQMLGDFHYRILGKNADGSLKMEGGWQNNRRMPMHAQYRFVEGIFEELDAPGEWFLNHTTHTLYYYPRPGIEITHAMVEGPHLRSLIEFNGAHGITLRGFTLQHTLRTFMDNREPLLRSDWTIYRGGALHFKGASGCALDDCALTDLGGNAVFVDGKNRDLAFRRCRIENVGANGVAFVGSPKAVRSPLFEYNQRQAYSTIDTAPGPASDDYPADCLVEDCLIDHTGTVEKQTAGVQIAMARAITVRHCSIYHMPRAGINIGDGCWGGDIVEGCDIFDTVLETGDHGSFNSWGRDRYWGLTDVNMNLGERPDLAALDTVDPIVLRNNRWRCDHGWDIDLDDGSSRYVIENNLCLNGGIKNREGFGRVVQNNIMVGNSFHPHVWFHNSGDIFRRNIVFTAYRPIGVAKPWGAEIDNNLLQTPGQSRAAPAAALAAQSGRDEHSLTGDADFVDPAHGDFRVRHGSPALALGFVNFRMDDFGVRTPALRARARQPQFGSAAAGRAATPAEADWLGAHLKELIDPGDISATGSTEHAGILVVSVTPDSAAAELGLEPLDVITAINGKSVISPTLIQVLTGAEVRTVTLWRRQHAETLTAQPSR